ncbi:hypothetical protein [Gelidibacter japonicus]|uniref:hypothetical protein n=1 Tax=Gelidibacter japonicus TaxID=1962232 RepID=UPI003A91CE53
MKKLVLLSALVFGLVFYSCSSDDDNGANDRVSLVGEWRLTNVDFITMKEGGRPASDACIVELVAGYEFHSDSKFYFILGDSDRPLFDPYAQDYWTWEGDSKDFEIVQTNPMSPPYNFGLSPENIKTKQMDGKVTMTFQSKMGNGSEANFTLVKEPIDKTKTPELTDANGESYYCGFFDPK